MSEELYQEEIGRLSAANAALREQIARTSAEIVNAGLIRRADVEAEFGRLRADAAAAMKNDPGYRRFHWDGYLEGIEAAHKRLMGGAA